MLWTDWVAWRTSRPTSSAGNWRIMIRQRQQVANCRLQHKRCLSQVINRRAYGAQACTSDARDKSDLPRAAFPCGGLPDREQWAFSIINRLSIQETSPLAIPFLLSPSPLSAAHSVPQSLPALQDDKRSLSSWRLPPHGGMARA